MLRKFEADETPINPLEPAEALATLAPMEPAELAEDVPELYGGSDSHDICREAAARVRRALENDEFRLYCQRVRSLAADALSFQEVVIRQAEEEQNMMPPGAFLALAEECALLPELDRWAVTGILRAVFDRRRADARWRPSMYCTSLSRETISDPFFPEYVLEQAAAFGVSPDRLCFEVQECDVMERRTDCAAMVRQLRSSGVHMMLGGFGRQNICFNVLKEIRFDFLKIHGGIILSFARNEASLTRLLGILRVARTVGIGTVAELVESEDIASRLCDLGVNYAQGAAISTAVPLADLT